MTITSAKINRTNWQALGQNAHIVVEREQAGFNMTEVALRRGRVENGEAVQISITITRHDKNGRSIETHGGLSLDQETWDTIVTHVKRDRNISHRRAV